MTKKAEEQPNPNVSLTVFLEDNPKLNAAVKGILHDHHRYEKRTPDEWRILIEQILNKPTEGPA